MIEGAEQVVGGRSADGASVFEIGSITKVFTGTLLALMHLRGEVALDDPLSRHLDEPRLAWSSREPTLLELATHRAGLPNVPRPLGRRELAYALGFGSRDPWADVTGASWARMVADAARQAEPAGKVAYSSMGVGLLGDALAARAGLPFAELLSERILRPLAMHATTLTVRADLLQGHSRRGRPRPPIEDLIPAAGGLRSTVEDMLRFLRACADPGDDELGEALALAQRPQADQGKRMKVGLCWMILRRGRQPPLIWHNGETWGFRSFAGLVPSRKRAAVALSNTARSLDRFGLDLLERP